MLKRWLRWAMKPLIYRYPPVGLQPERLHLWLDTLKKTRGLDGAVVEIGCNVCGTAAVAKRMLNRLGDERRYICIDTFSGFVPWQFELDRAHGTPAGHAAMFDGNSEDLARWICEHHGAPEVELRRGDIVEMPDDALPETVSALLVDVDLSEPVYRALRRMAPRLRSGGVILVDDCPEGYEWKARAGYERFIAEIGQRPEYDSGMGILRRPGTAGSAI